MITLTLTAHRSAARQPLAADLSAPLGRAHRADWAIGDRDRHRIETVSHALTASRAGAAREALLSDGRAVSLGGLFSAYAIFYSRSVTLTSTAIFFALLVLLLVGNEFLRDRLSSLRLLVSLYALVCFAFSRSFSRS